MSNAEVCASSALAIEVVVLILRSLTDPRCHQMADLLAAGYHVEALQYIGDDSIENADTYLAAEIISKADFLDLGADKAAVAVSKFEEGELSCLNTNIRLRDASLPVSMGWDAGTWLVAIRRKIEQILGEFSWDEAAAGFGFGPGASIGLSRKHSCRANKIGMKPTASSGAILVGPAVLRWFDLWGALHNFECVPVVGNKVVTVPKNAKTDRVIAIEPLVNLVLQKGIGRCLKNRLLRVGIDLSNQQRNRDLALEASVHGRLATVDLSAASDTIATGLVDALLPDDWLRAMHWCRSERGVLPSGKVIHYQKFSSMGNGFTFELESLLFYAMSVTVLSRAREIGLVDSDAHRCVSVYGDDIVIPVEIVDQLQEVFGWAGFVLNRKKTHSTGGFRESCGTHALHGVDITPFYVRRPLRTISDKLLLANNIARYASRQGCYGHWRDARLLGAWRRVVASLPPQYRTPRIPDGFGDSALVGDFSECLPQRARHGLDGWVTRAWLRVQEYHPVGWYTGTVASLMTLEEQNGGTSTNEKAQEHPKWDASGGLRPLSENEGEQGPPARFFYRKAPLFVPKQWQGLGPWL